VRRIVTIALSLSFLLGLSAVSQLLAQDPPKDDTKKEASKEDAKKEASKDDAPKEAPKDDAKKADTPKADTPATPVEEPLPTIPPEVEAKLEAARKAVAELIVAAQDAGLVESSIDPPSVLDILITGRALDERRLKKALTQPEVQVGVNPEVFGAWFTGYGKMPGIVAQKSVRVIEPSKGLKAWYDQRNEVLKPHLEAARKAKLAAAAPKPDAPKPDAPKTEAPKADAPKTEEPKADAPKADAPKADAPKADAPKADTPKTEEPKADAPKADAPKADAPKTEEPKAEVPKS
jgi:pentapeptide MXKDX repeat protein